MFPEQRWPGAAGRREDNENLINKFSEKEIHNNFFVNFFPRGVILLKNSFFYTSEIPLIYDEWKSHAYPSDIHGLVFLIVIKNKHDC